MSTILAPPRADDDEREDDVDGFDPMNVCHRLVPGGGGSFPSLCGRHGMFGSVQARRRDGRCIDCGQRACPDCEAIHAG